MRLSVRQGVGEFPGVGEQFGVVFEQIHEFAGLLYVIQQVGVFLSHSQDGGTDFPIFLFAGFDFVVFKRLSAPHASVFVAGRFLPAPGTIYRADRVGISFFDVFAVQFRVRRVGFPTELVDIVGGDVASPLATLSVFDKRLRHTLPGQPRRVRLAEVSRGDGFVDTGPLRGVFETIQVLPVADSVGFRQFRPKRGVGIVGCRVVGQPSIQVRHRRDKRHRTLSLLAVDKDLQAVFVVGNVADRQGLQFPASGTGIERNGYQGGVPGVLRFVYHGFDVVFPRQHFGGVRSGVVAVTCPRRHPCDTVGLVFNVAVGDVPGENPKGVPVIGVRPFAFVLPVNPPHDVFGGVFVFKGVGKPADVFGDSGTPTQQVAVSKVGIFGLEQVQLVAELNQQFGVPSRDLVRIADTVTVVFDLGSGFGHVLIAPIPFINYITRLLNLWFISRPRLFCPYTPCTHTSPDTLV